MTNETPTPTSPTCAECDHECVDLTRPDCASEMCCVCVHIDEPCPTCSDRRDRESERAYESFCEDFYGGSQPVTIEEQYQAAAAQKRRLS